MGVNEVTNIIGALGFPIAACVFLAWYLTSKFEKMVDTMVQTQKEFRDTIDANSKLLSELIILVKERGLSNNE